MSPSAVGLDSDTGFFPDPGSIGMFVPRVPAVRLSEVGEQRCLVLLGEPGLGKSRTIAQDTDERQGYTPSGRLVIRRVDLGAFDDATLLRQALFGNPVWCDWLAGDHTLELWLDSLDEALLHLRAVEKLLTFELGEVDPDVRDRLRLRIVCRSADWSDSFESELRRLWPGSEAFLALQLAPLRRCDVVLAARTHGLVLSAA